MCGAEEHGTGTRHVAATPLLEVTDLAYAYNGVAAVRGVSFTVGAGEVVALLGANGAGKTTTVKTIAGALAPQAGSIRFDGAAIEGRPCHVVVRRGITLVPEGRLVFPQLSVDENLAIGAHTRPPAEAAVTRERVLCRDMCWGRCCFEESD